jgi:hypothetical protein
MNYSQLLLEMLNRNTKILLECGDNAAEMKQAVDQLYRIYSSITKVKVDQINIDKDIMLPSGKAISTAAAAHCLLEMKRTAVFLRGINKAIALKLSQATNKSIRILYVGTGPYGTLLTPLLPLYKPTDIKVDVLDINQKSLIALHELVAKLELEDYIDEMHYTDASTFAVTKQYDIVICETMLACLKSEPQVAIMQHLIPQLTDDCIFIPEEISIDASLTNPKMEMDRLLYYEAEQPPFERISLGNIFKLNKQTIHKALERKRISIPDKTANFPMLKLFTTVTVFEDEVLIDNDSSITLPKQYYDFRREEAKEIEFWYVQGEKPRIESCAVEPLRIHEIITI